MKGSAIAARIAAAMAGGYALATATAVAATALPGPKSESALIGIMLGFAAYTAAMIWAFAARSALRAWTGLLIPSVVLTLIGLVR